MPTSPESSPQSREELLRVIEARDAEVNLLKLMVRKLQTQLARRNRADFGSTSERFENVQGTLLEAQPLDEVPPRPAAPKVAANAPQIDRSLPEHLPREDLVHRPGTTAAHHDGWQAVRLRRLWRTAAPDRARGLRAAGVRAGALQGDPARAPQACVREVPDDLPGSGTQQAHRQGRCRPGAARARHGRQIL
jgi:hypothetical protein